VISSGTIAALCTVFAENLGYFIHIPDNMEKYVAMLSIIALTLFNMFGIRLSEWFANIGTALKILGIYGLIIAAFLLGDQVSLPTTNAADVITEPSYAGALVGVLWSYTGWHYASFVSGEAQNPARNIPLAMIFGTTLVTLTYVFCNLAYLNVFSHSELATMATSGQNKLAAVEVMHVILPGMSWLMPALIGLSVFACAGLYILSTPRIFNQMSHEGLFFSVFAKNHPKFGVPVNAILLQSFWAMLLVYIWGRFSSIIEYVTFIEWLFLLITCVGIFRIRKKESHLNAPFKVPLYPILPLVFISIVGWFIIQNAIADKPEYYAGLAVIPIGLIVYYIFRHTSKSKSSPL
jgi:APA family basic amino acid/polyamine antiporter